MSTNAPAITGWYFKPGDGKDVKVADGFRMIRVSQAEAGKRGKGKTIATICIPQLPQLIELNAETLQACQALLAERLEGLQTKIVQRAGKLGQKAIAASDVDLTACLSEFAAESFSPESVGVWFDTEVSDALGFAILTSKGWNPENLNSEQVKYLETKCAAYRASFQECAAKFPGLSPDQVQELLRVINLLELSGGMVDNIREKISPKATAQALGF